MEKYIFYHTPHCGGTSTTRHLKNNKKQVISLLPLGEIFEQIYNPPNKLILNDNKKFILNNISKDFDLLEIHGQCHYKKYYNLCYKEIFDFFIIKNFNEYKKTTIIREPKDLLLKSLIRNPKLTFDLKDVYVKNDKFNRDFSIFYTLPLIYNNKQFFDLIIDINNIDKLMEYLNVEKNNIPHISHTNHKINLNEYNEKLLFKRVKNIELLDEFQMMHHTLLS